MFSPVKIVSISPENKQLLIKAGLGVALLLWGKHLYDNWQKSQGEAAIDSPAGQIAVQLKNIFNSRPVDDAAYRRVMQLVTKNNEEDVRDIYRKLTGRFLSDDEASHITTSTQQTAAHQYQINNTPGTLISIINDEIKFNVGRGSLVRFAPGQTTPINLYLKAEDIATGVKPAVSMPPNSKYWQVTDTKLIPLKGIKLRTDWKLIFAPILPLFAIQRTSKEYAAIQIDLSGGKGQTFAWANATDFRTQKTFSGFEGVDNAPIVIAIQQAQIFDEKFKQTGTVPKGVIIGLPIMTLDTGKVKYIKLVTVQGLVRWIKANQVTIKNLRNGK